MRTGERSFFGSVLEDLAVAIEGLDFPSTASPWWRQLRRVLVCSRHHHVPHQPGWHAKLRPDGTFEVTDPNGQVRCTSPPRGKSHGVGRRS